MVDDTARDRAIYQALKAVDEVAAALQTHLIEEHGADPERAAAQSPATNALRLLRQARERSRPTTSPSPTTSRCAIIDLESGDPCRLVGDAPSSSGVVGSSRTAHASAGQCTQRPIEHGAVEQRHVPDSHAHRRARNDHGQNHPGAPLALTKDGSADLAAKHG